MSRTSSKATGRKYSHSATRRGQLMISPSRWLWTLRPKLRQKACSADFHEDEEARKVDDAGLVGIGPLDAAAGAEFDGHVSCRGGRR